MEEVARLRFSRSSKCRAEFRVCSPEESGGGIHANQVRKCRGIHLWTLMTIKLMYIDLNPLSSFAMTVEHLLIDPLFRRDLERLKETQMHIWNNNLSPGYTNPFWVIGKQVQGWLRLLNTPQCFYLSKAHPLPAPEAVSGAKFPSSHVASVILSTQSVFLVGLFILSKYFKVRLGLLWQSDIPSNHF